MRNQAAGWIASLVFGVIFTAVGGGLIYFWAWPVIEEAKASEVWPETSGKITVSRVETRRGKENKRTYQHHVEYTFAVDGVQHTGDRVYIGDDWSTGSSRPAKRMVSKYPVGSETTVYYDPQSPDDCVLQKGTNWMTYMPLAFGGVFFLIGALLTGAVVLKLVLGGLFIGAAATAASTKPPVTSSPYHNPSPGKKFSANDDDDGIEIS